MNRCLQLAALGQGRVAPNPMVGALLVYQGRILGEGWHRQYGGAHAEVEAIRSVRQEDRPLIPLSTLYVSLEPCSHHGKTPPCTDLILRERIPEVVIAMADPFNAVNGRGIQRLRDAGVRVTMGVMQQEAAWLNRQFITAQEKRRPYITLKWAQTADGFMGSGSSDRLIISSPIAQQEVHQWRTAYQAILVGAGTALLDNPQLTNRLAPGTNPVRLLIDPKRRVPDSAALFNSAAKTVVFSYPTALAGATTVSLAEGPILPQVMDWCYEAGIHSILVEGGAFTLQQFLEHGLWDEIRCLRSETVLQHEGLKAPSLPADVTCWMEYPLGTDRIQYFRRKQ